MTEAQQIAILRDYAAGNLGTRTTIDALDLRDFADLIIVLVKSGLDLPRPSDSATLAMHEERARALLMPRLRRAA